MLDEEKLITAKGFAESLGVADKVEAPAEAEAPAEEVAPTEQPTETAAAPTDAVKTEPVSTEATATTEAKPQERVFTQAELNAIVAERIAREKKARQQQEELVAKLEGITSKPLDKFIEEYRTKAAQDLADEEGIDLDVAQKRIESNAELIELRRKQAELEAQQKQIEAKTVYHAAKQKYSQHQLSSLVREIEAEVDGLSNEGAVGDFDSALFYTIGRQIMTGDLYNRIAEKIRKDVTASIGKKQASGVESPSSGPSQAEMELTAEQKKYANLTGVSHKAYAEQLKGIEKTRRG